MKNNNSGITHNNNSFNKQTMNNNQLYKYQWNGYKIKFDNLNEQLSKHKIMFDENGLFDFGKNNKIDYAKVFTPFKIVESDNRYFTMQKIINQLVALNKDNHRSSVEKTIYTINHKKMLPPVELEEIELMIEDAYSRIENLKPYNQSKRRFIYDESKNFTPTQKRRLVFQKLAKDKSEKTKSELYSVMRDWDFSEYGKMTIKKIRKITGKNVKTIQKYYSDLKKDIDNEEYDLFF